jgi:hypothetical protein
VLEISKAKRAPSIGAVRRGSTPAFGALNSSKMHKNVILMLILTTLSCGPPVDTKQFKPKNDEVNLWVSHDKIDIKANPSLSELVDLNVFAGLQPGLTDTEAKLRFGPPTRITKDYSGTFYHYDINGRSVALAHLESSSMGATWEDWCIYAYPKNPTTTDVFREPITSALKHRSGDVVLMVFSGDRDMRVSANLKNGSLTEIRLYEIKY